MTGDTWGELGRRMGELRDFLAVVGLLTWDQETYLPAGASESRAMQLSAMQALLHERLTDPRLGELIAAAEDGALDDDRRAMLRNLRRDRDRAVKLPVRLVRELAETQTRAVEAWRAARQESRFELFQPHLERVLALRREQADALGHGGERYDALLDVHEPGMRVARLEPIFAALQQALVPIVETITAAQLPPSWDASGKRFPAERQWPVTVKLLQEMGFDLERGRQDRSAHPFTDGIHVTDVRLTTRFSEDSPLPALFGTIHEGGHGLYEQNLPADHARDPIGIAASMGLHESQSRLWENMIGRSLPFWEWFLPELVAAFPAELAGTTPRTFHAAVNRVVRSLIRVEADEVTYNLHILLRFRLELSLLRGDLPLSDLPGAWNDAMARDLGIRPPDDARGVLQDIHWAWGELGYFPTYTLGNLYAAVLHARMDQELGGIDAAVRRGELHRVRDWLAAKVHRPGHLHDAEEIVRLATGTGLAVEPFLAYLRGKYGELYGVRL